jgi:tRNA-dihydrouridine synthase A
MAQPAQVRDCLAAMLDAVDIPVTIKHRTGIDDLDSWEHLRHFVATVADSGCRTFIVHARKAWLRGLSPKQNRDIPPLQYDTVFLLKQEFPELEFVINGGIESVCQSLPLLQHVDGVMLGRAAYQNPGCLAQVDPRLFGTEAPSASQLEVVERMLPYIEAQLGKGCRLNHITRHMTGLFQGTPGARKYRRHLSENASLPGAGIEVLTGAVAELAQSATELAAAAY